MLPLPLTKRLVNHAHDDDITEGYAANWTVEQLREPAQRVAERIEALLESAAPAPEAGPVSSHGDERRFFERLAADCHAGRRSHGLVQGAPSDETRSGFGVRGGSCQSECRS